MKPGGANMRALSLALLTGLWCVSQAPAVLAGTRATVEDSARIEDELCRGWDGNWYLPGAKECQPLEAAAQSPAPPERADTQEETDAAQASEGSGSQSQFLFLVAAIAVIALAAAGIAAGVRIARRALPSDAEPGVQPPDRAAQSQPDQPEMERPVPPAASEDLSAGPAPGESEDVHDQPALVNGAAPLVTVWTGAPCTVEFTCKDPDGEQHRNTVDITRIMRDPRDGGWHLHGFCHLWREERDYDGASIVTKILYKSRRWNLEDWITAIAGKETRGS
jgi:hypothetical protein